MELSHLKGVIEEGNHLVPFLKSVLSDRNRFSEEEKQAAISAAIIAMRDEGIVAVGDIANGIDTLKHRPDSGLHIHTFVESLGFTQENASARFAYSENIYHQFAAQEEKDNLLRQSIVPHAPYSVSFSLFELINNFDKNAILSIHNQETLAEDDFYLTKTGAMLDLHRSLNIDASFFKASGKTSLQSYLPLIDSTHSMLFVHNTFTSLSDIDFLKNAGFDYVLCLCPNANLYIEKQLPPVTLFLQNELPICLGTDSLSSNHQLSIWSEIQTLREHFPEISLETMLTWATYNGAKALKMDHLIGSFEKGKKPGFVAINKNLESAKKFF